VASARALAALEHVHGLDLLAYRYTGDVPQLMADVSAAVAKPVIVAGSIDSADGWRPPRRPARRASPWAPPRWPGAFPAETEGFAGQVRAILAITARAQRHVHRAAPHRAGGP
jgi:hypothetical protein